MANFVLINKDEPAACQVWVADVDIPDEATATSITADHKYLKSLGNTLWSKDFSKGYTYESSGWVNIAGGGSTGSALFIATPNTTTCAEIITAIEAGKVVMAKDANRYYMLQAYTPLIVKFVSANVNNFGNYTYTWSVNAQNTWVYSYGYPSVFVATYGTTSYNDIKAALWAGQTVICHRKFTVPDEQIEQYILTFCGPGGASFTHTDQNVSNETFSRAVKVDSNNNWQTTDLLSNAMTAGTGITIEDATITSGGVSKVVKKISATGGGGGIFYCETGITTGEQMVAAYNAGKQLIVKDEFNQGKFRYADLEYYKPDVSYPEFYFTVIINEHSIRYMYTDGQWTSTETILQTQLPVIQGTDTF